MYCMRNGKQANVESVTLLPSAERLATADSNGSAIELGDRRVLRCSVDVTAKSGTMTSLDVTIQTSKDGVTWYTAKAFTQVGNSATNSERFCFPIDRFVRAHYVIVGATYGYTFSVTAEAA
jgi:hypothetical protein